MFLPDGFTDTALKTKSVNLHIEENRSEHHTSEYEHEELLVRRGQKFKVSLSFNRPYNESQDSLVLQFVTGKLVASRTLQNIANSCVREQSYSCITCRN